MIIAKTKMRKPPENCRKCGISMVLYYGRDSKRVCPILRRTCPMEQSHRNGCMKYTRFCKVISDHANATIKADELQEVEAIDMAISTLRLVSRERVEKMQGEEETK